MNPQPDDHPDDPLNWASWRRDIALLSLGWHCLVGGGQTPVLAAGFNDVAKTFDVSIPDVALTTGKPNFNFLAGVMSSFCLLVLALIRLPRYGVFVVLPFSTVSTRILGHWELHEI